MGGSILAWAGCSSHPCSDSCGPAHTRSVSHCLGGVPWAETGQTCRLPAPCPPAPLAPAPLPTLSVAQKSEGRPLSPAGALQCCPAGQPPDPAEPCGSSQGAKPSVEGARGEAPGPAKPRRSVGSSAESARAAAALPSRRGIPSFPCTQRSLPSSTALTHVPDPNIPFLGLALQKSLQHVCFARSAKRQCPTLQLDVPSPVTPEAVTGLQPERCHPVPSPRQKGSLPPRPRGYSRGCWKAESWLLRLQFSCGGHGPGLPPGLYRASTAKRRMLRVCRRKHSPESRSLEAAVCSGMSGGSRAR